MEVDDTLASCRSRFDLPENAVRRSCKTDVREADLLTSC